jgi:hypothetical protein
LVLSEVDATSESEVVLRELYKRRLLEYSDLAERGIEPSRKWMSYHLGHMIAGATIADRIKLARNLASKL